MMFPKRDFKKKRKKHKDSIMQHKDRRCYLCMKLEDNDTYHTVLHEHHAFGGANRDNSEAEGLKVYLCVNHHVNGPAAVHNNQKNMRLIQQDAQRAYERTHSREEFMELFGRNYLE
ncbi:MAG: hypothetical protein Q4B26_04805 [Eubacteriales bacterium]|nr:hypothetical protein [Eubacteriales bacterium]